MNYNIDEDTKAAPILCHATPRFIFHPDAPEFSPNILTDGYEWHTLPASAKGSHPFQALTNTETLETSTPEAVRAGKINSNRAQPTEVKAVSPRLPANPEIDVILEASFEGINGDSEYVDSTRNLPTR